MLKHTPENLSQLKSIKEIVFISSKEINRFMLDENVIIELSNSGNKLIISGDKLDLHGKE